MEIVETEDFLKAFSRLSKQQKEAALWALALFRENPKAPELRNHALKREFAGIRSIDAAADLRILFREKGGYITVVLLAVGSHKKLYE